MLPALVQISCGRMRAFQVSVQIAPHMHRRPFLTTVLSALMLLPLVKSVQGAEAAGLGPDLFRNGILDEPVRDRITLKLTQQGFVINGEPRRKGQFVVVLATRASVPWRLVIDGTTAEIIGRRPLGQLISLQE